MSRWQVFSVGSVLGVVLALAGAYLYTKESRNFLAQSPYVRAASEAKLDIAVLRKLKEGDIAGASEVTESRLKLREATLTEYAELFTSSEQDPAVLSGARAIEQYRSEVSE